MTVAQINVSKNGFYKGERLFISSSFIGKKSGKTKGFEIIEILLVAHGGWHNDTICTVDYKK